ncbi:chorismate--pyruvate lyase family protein [Brachymonas denitrificans]|uniref:chorismate--pyruvate lyase family protein n=1 Tax=Brachymonas denitrificans TaxID=28220 RepID=UPI002B002362|nr:chorismate lyase [Brachymonas denitrificans]
MTAAPAPLTPNPLQLHSLQRRPVAARMRHWLQAEGSLTRHLTRASGRVQVQVLQQGSDALWPEEARALRRQPFQQAGSAHVRTVLLWCGPTGQERPAVLARSAVLAPQSRLRWRGLRGLGDKPLAQLLFDTPHIHRSPLRWHHDAAHSPAARHVLQLWQRHAPEHTAMLPRQGVWRRSSVFDINGARILVTEWFAPEVFDWPAPK